MGKSNRTNTNTPSKKINERKPASIETLCSDAMERIARMIGVSVDLDDPEPALVAAVERKIATLVERANGLAYSESRGGGELATAARATERVR